MKAYYEDIRKRIKEEPKWFDENGVPRYDEFHPKLSPNIYADEVALLEIKCQNCGRRFLVELNWDMNDKIFRNIPSLEARIKNNSIHYGDPPIHLIDGEPCVGNSMNSVPLKVVQFWRRGIDKGWVRVKKLEKTIDVDWWKE